MSRRMIRFAALGAVVVASLGLAMCSVFLQRDEIKFSHHMHIVVEELECSDCHKKMDDAEDLSASHIPDEKRCFKCHSDMKEDCAFCHLDPDKPTTFQTRITRGLVFDHGKHIERVQEADVEEEDEEGCRRCHQGALAAPTPSDSRGPKMFDECMSCHRQDYRKIDCMKCHADFYAEKLMPATAFDHQGDFITRHGDLARGDMTVCSHCHQESSCAQCHSKMAPAAITVLRSDEPGRWRMHEGDWMARHAIEARTGSSQCMTCHTPDRCSSCHEDSAVAAAGGFGLGPHPSSWLIAGSSAFHGDAARRNIATCATCHDRGPDTNCIGCHRPGGTGGSPHPPGWSTRIDRDEGQACVWCHQ